jgi:hypothetical protein
MSPIVEDMVAVEAVVNVTETVVEKVPPAYCLKRVLDSAGGGDSWCGGAEEEEAMVASSLKTDALYKIQSFSHMVLVNRYRD